jgi:hypothetical protein
MRDQELILRFLALLFEGQDYEQPMVAFLNRYMGKHKNIADAEASVMKRAFWDSIDLVFQSIGSRAFRPVRALNAAVFSVMVGTAKRLQNGAVSDLHAYQEAYEMLLANQSFLDSCGRGTAGKERVRKRLELATISFAAVP